MARKITGEAWAVIGLVLAVLAIHLLLAFQTSTLSSDAYFVLRQAEHIKAAGTPLFNDPLSYSGRTYLFPPLFHYMVALLAFVFSTAAAAKIAASLCLSLSVAAVYMISRHITKNKGVSFVAALFAGFTPALYAGLSNPSPSSLSLLLILLLSYAFIRIEEPNAATYAVILSVLLLLTSTDVIIFIIGILFYFTILFLENSKSSRKEGELTIFLFFFSVWFNVLLYKKAFFSSGIATLWANLPAALLSNYFQDITFVGLIYSAGLIPLILGVYAVYSLVFESKNRPSQLFIGIAIASFAALWLRVIPINTGLLLFSTSMVILSANTMKSALLAAQKTKFPSLPKILAGIILLLFFVTTLPVLASLHAIEPQSAGDIQALEWIANNTPKDAVVLSQVDEGFMVNYFANRKNVADNNFLFIRDAGETYNDVQALYSLRLSSEAVRLLDKHGVSYIFMSSKARAEYGSRLGYADNPGCFSEAYSGAALVYEFKGCRI